MPAPVLEGDVEGVGAGSRTVRDQIDVQVRRVAARCERRSVCPVGGPGREAEREQRDHDELHKRSVGCSAMVREATVEQTEHGLVPSGPGWYVVNAREVPWRAAEGRGAYSVLEGEPELEQYGVHLVT